MDVQTYICVIPLTSTLIFFAAFKQRQWSRLLAEWDAKERTYNRLIRKITELPKGDPRKKWRFYLVNQAERKVNTYLRHSTRDDLRKLIDTYEMLSFKMEELLKGDIEGCELFSVKLHEMINRGVSRPETFPLH